MLTFFENIIQYCISQGFYSCTNIMTKKQVREESVYSAYTSTLLFLTKGRQDWKQELMQRPRRDVTYWLASPGLLSLLSYRTEDYQPRDGTTHNGLGPPQLITNWENALQLSLMKPFLQLRLLFYDNSSLLSWHTKLASQFGHIDLLFLHSCQIYCLTLSLCPSIIISENVQCQFGYPYIFRCETIH